MNKLSQFQIRSLVGVHIKHQTGKISETLTVVRLFNSIHLYTLLTIKIVSEQLYRIIRTEKNIKIKLIMGLV